MEGCALVFQAIVSKWLLVLPDFVPGVSIRFLLPAASFKSNPLWEGGTPSPTLDHVDEP